MNEKFGIDTFYVGELCLSEKIDNYIYLRLQKEVKQQTVNGGAVKEETLPLQFDYDERKRIRYDTYITLFQQSDYGYRCLHNGLSYTIDGDDYCKNLYPLSTFLPKVGYKSPSVVSKTEALELFRNLFNDGELELNGETRKVDDYYVGNLFLCSRYYNMCQEHRNNGFDQVNELSERLIKKSGIGYKEDFHIGSDTLDRFFYKTYKGVFIYSNGLVFLHDNQKYSLETMTGDLKSVQPGLSYCGNLVPYKEYMNLLGVKVENEISPQKALTLFKK